MKEIQVTVYDKQIYETHYDEAENRFVGNLAIKDGCVYITYKDEKDKITTVVKWKNNVVSVKRMGTVQAKLIFDVEQAHSSSYQMPYGTIDMVFQTDKIDIYYLEKGVKLYIEYKIMMDNQKISDNIYMIVAN